MRYDGRPDTGSRVHHVRAYAVCYGPCAVGRHPEYSVCGGISIARNDSDSHRRR